MKKIIVSDNTVLVNWWLQNQWYLKQQNKQDLKVANINNDNSTNDDDDGDK